jgi:hypothetical protein
MKRKKCKKSRRVGQARIEFTNKPITAWGGMATLVAKFIEQIGFRGWVGANIPIGETSNNAKGVYEKVLAQFLTALIGGWRFAHLLWWEHGIEAIHKTFAVKWLPRAPSTLTRFWGKIKTQAMAERLGAATRDLARQIVEFAGLREDTLNLDSTVLTRYGRQEGAKKGYNPKKRGRPSHHPLLAFLGSGYVVNLWNRSGNTGAGQNAVPFFRQTLVALGKGFSVRRVLCDSGFYLIDFIEYLEGKGLSYIIAARISSALQSAIFGVERWERVDEGLEVGEFFFEHRDAKWTRPRRYVVVRQLITRRPKAAGKQLSLFKELEDWNRWRYSLMITNDLELPAVEVWRQYRPRANDENVLKDLKEGYGFAAFNLKGFWATEAVMMMGALVFHNMIHYLNGHILNRGGPRPQLTTLRAKYFILPAQLGRCGGTSVLRVAVKPGRLRAKLTWCLEQIARLPWRLNCNAVET